MSQLVIKWHIVLMYYVLYIYIRRFKYGCINNEIVYSNITNRTILKLYQLSGKHKKAVEPA